MKKLIIALDGQHFPKGAFEFAKSMNAKTKVLLAGVFLSPVDYSKLLAYTGMQGMTLMPEWLTRNNDDVLVSKNISLFTEACSTAGIEFRIHKDTDLMALSSLIDETRFADALLISSELFYANVSVNQPNFYLEEVLKKAECPVMLVPENYTEPDHVVLAYDGNESSVYALKQFAYVFAELTQKETILLALINHEDDLPEYSLITELVSRHYPDLKIQTLHLKNKKDFAEWMTDKPNSFIVMGAFSRSLFSQLFRKSFASDIIHDIKMPLFISHK
ncbi:MAG: hypothetical protein IPN43_17610 [Chitinophagaceae bacterium]|nr:hypothetical protein [Chitinophagaceae bacterium]MBL0202278.1 hypothetical protein [Chitinophagaceae bacterium]